MGQSQGARLALVRATRAALPKATEPPALWGPRLDSALAIRQLAGNRATGALAAYRSSGARPLHGHTRPFFERRFGQDFGHVRIHTDAGAARAAASLEARAFTTGHDIVFGAGEWAPQTPAGRRLLAHELAHVVQQTRMPDAPRVQRFTTREHTDIGNAAYALVAGEFRGAALRDSPLWSLLRDGSRFRQGEQVRTYGDVVADADFFATFEDMIGAHGERPGFWEDVDVGRLALRNIEHFAPHGIRQWLAAHDYAVTQMRFAHDQLAWGKDLLSAIDPLLANARQAILAGDDARAERLLATYRAAFERIRPRIERIIPRARALATEALQRNAFADHYLTDAFSAGHIITPREEIVREAHVNIRQSPPSRAATVRAALVPTWSEFWEVRAQVRSLAWHDLDNYFGVEVSVSAPGFAPWQACGDRCSERTERRHWDATRASAIRAEAESIKHLWVAGLTGRQPDYRTVLDLVPRPTWRNYPAWGAQEWENQLRYIRGERVPAIPGQRMPGPVAINLFPIEHCGVDLQLGCWEPFVLTQRDWIKEYSFDRWVRPWINRVKAQGAARYQW